MEGNDVDIDVHMDIDGVIEGKSEGGNYEWSKLNSEGEQIQRIISVEGKLQSLYPYSNEYRYPPQEDPSGLHSHMEEDLYGREGSKRREKRALGAESSLRNVLSDPLTGLLMDDAMVAQCGHSYGLRSLQRVLETNICLSCRAPVPPESLIPNYALRAAVEAYEREDFLSHKVQGVKTGEQEEQAEGSEQKFWRKASMAQFNCSDDITNDGRDLMGVQYPFLVDDCVIIKGNKDTPEHFVNREAVITAQYLNGWYMVRTLDSGESVCLQYHWLQKVGENEMPFHFESGSYLGELRDTTQKVDPMSASKGKGSRHSGQTSSNSSHELHGDLNEAKFMGSNTYGDEEKKSVVDKGADNMSRGIHFNSQHGRAGEVGAGNDGFSPEGASGHSAVGVDVGEIKRGKRGRGADGLQAVGIAGTQVGLDAFTVRSKRSSLTTKTSHVTGNASLSSSGPYRKVYISGIRRHGCNGNGSTVVSVIDKKPMGGNSPKSRGIMEVEDVKHDGSNPGGIQMEVLHMIKKGMANLEKDIPWICFQRMWRRHRSIWRKGLRESSTIQDLSIKLQELRSSLLLSLAGGMSDEEWEKQLNTVKDSGNTDLLIFLWRNFNEDVSKWMTAKAKRSQVHLDKKIEAHEYADLQKLFPTLIIEGFSSPGVTAAAAIAAAEAFAHDGSKNTDVLLKVPMKLIRQHNHHDLIILREALEREKRHISAKLAVLDSKKFKSISAPGQSVGSDQSIDKKPLIKVSVPDPHKLPGSISSHPFFVICENATPLFEQEADHVQCKSAKNLENAKDDECESS